MKNLESRIQQSIISYHRLQYPRVPIFAIPNGGARSPITGAILKAEGVMRGVADLFVMCNGGIFVEVKTEAGRQSPEQKHFQSLCAERGFAYFVCRSVTDYDEQVSPLITKP